jgi:hypothetical protein
VTEFGYVSLKSRRHRVLWIDQHSNPRCPRNEFFEQLELLSNETFGHERRKTGHIATGMRQALDQT